MRFLALSVLVCLLMVMPMAAAQGPGVPQATTTLTIEGLPAEIEGLEDNATISIPFSVKYSGSNFVCPEGGAVAISVTVSAQGAPAFFTVSVEPADGSISLSSPPSSSHSDTADFTLVAALTQIMVNASVPIQVTATPSPAASEVPCVPSAPTPDEASATTYANMTFVPPPEPTPEPPADSPGAGVVIGLVAATVAASVLRRKRN